MARDEAMHQLLLTWAQWVKVGDGSGYPVMSVLHKDWSPPSPGITPTMKVSAQKSAKRTHRMIARLSDRQRDAVVVHYCCNLSVAQQAKVLGCAERTVHERVATVHMTLRAWLNASDHGVFENCAT